MICLVIYLSFLSGVFEPPVDGVYLLTVYAITDQVKNGPMYIRSNDDVLCQAHVTETDFSAATCTAIAELTTADSVRVTGDSSNPADIRASDAGFVGHIIVE